MRYHTTITSRDVRKYFMVKDSPSSILHLPIFFESHKSKRAPSVNRMKTRVTRLSPLWPVSIAKGKGNGLSQIRLDAIVDAITQIPERFSKLSRSGSSDENDEDPPSNRHTITYNEQKRTNPSVSFTSLLVEHSRSWNLLKEKFPWSSDCSEGQAISFVITRQFLSKKFRFTASCVFLKSCLMIEANDLP